jgi:anaerobic selenocysteine-containing dehydrogenase/Fe-S-cluster-containing dehydrogenase component
VTVRPATTDGERSAVSGEREEPQPPLTAHRSPDEPNTVDRRRFLKVLGVSTAGAAALSGCSTGKIEKLIPYLVQSEDQVPGIPTWYASTCTECPTGCGLHVKTREARAIKLEGNPAHPVNAGTLCQRGQAGLQGLYNPGRTNGPLLKERGAFRPMLWEEVIGRLAQQLDGARGRIAVISGAGPGSFDDLLADWTRALGGRLLRYQPFDRAPERLANQRVFGLDELPLYDFAKARYILSFGADFLETWGPVIEQQRGFAQAHGFSGTGMARHVYVAPRMDLTGMNADEWHPLVPGSEASLALGLASVILSERTSAPPDANALTAGLSAYSPERVARDTGLTPDAIRKLAREFVSAAPSLAVAGGIAAQHRGAVDGCAAVALLNYVAGNVGQTVRFGAGLPKTDDYTAMEQLIVAMASGQIGVVLVHDANPLYALPRNAKFAEAFAKVPFKVSTALFLDETAAACDLLLPGHHALERWDDLRPRAGVRGLMQPVMTPVFDTLPTGDALLRTAQKLPDLKPQFPAPSFEAHLKQKWGDLARARGAADPEQFWRDALQHGGIFNETTAASPTVKLSTNLPSYPPTLLPSFDGDGEFILLPVPSSMYFDGRGANRPWLLENPDPVTKITWGSWVELNPETARRLDVREGEIVRVTSPHGTVELPVYVYPGVRPDVAAIPLGLGHTEFGEYAKGLGVNPLDLLAATNGGGFLPYVATKVSIGTTLGFHKLAKTEGNPRQLGRHIAEAMPLAHAQKGYTVEESLKQVGEAEHEVNTERELEAIAGFRGSQLEKGKLGAYAEEHPRWGMVIDLAKCTGCSACVTACYAENNIPWVGYDNVTRGREMSWMRIERYFEGGEAPGEPFAARVVPMLCQHCENAPCEPVCPVYAAYHTADGLNGQVYNRCVGTRYCSNNCPYKVRYFNWFPFAKRAFQAPLDLQLNPDVTVRARGVMEKCTFCIQRIRGAQHQARLEDRALQDGDVQTACQQACPSGAIVFGNVKDPESRVVKAREDHREYHVLEELNVRPSVTYLAKVQA